MIWEPEQLRAQAEVILNMFYPPLTTLETDRAVKEWSEKISFIPEGWFDNLPGDFAQNHALGSLQQIATRIVRERP